MLYALVYVTLYFYTILKIISNIFYVIYHLLYIICFISDKVLIDIVIGLLFYIISCQLSLYKNIIEYLDLRMSSPRREKFHVIRHSFGAASQIFARLSRNRRRSLHCRAYISELPDRESSPSSLRF